MGRASGAIRGLPAPWLFALLLATAACDTETALEVGGGSDSFEPIAENSVVSIVCGPQGGQHIWTSVRTETLNPLDADLTVTIVDDTGATVCHEELDDVLLLPNGSWNEFDGIRCFVADPNAADGHHATLTGTMTDNTGKHASASVSFTITGPGVDCADQ